MILCNFAAVHCCVTLSSIMFRKLFLLFGFTFLSLFVNLISSQGLAENIQSQISDSNYLPAPDDTTELHEITLFLMPTMYPLDWSSPSSLYKTMLNIYMKTIGLKDNYLLGHLAVRLTTPLLKEPLFTAQSSLRWQERVDMVLKQRVGYGILGAALQGRIEPAEEIQHKLRIYRDRKKLGFITFRVNRTAMQRMLTFLNGYQQKITEEYAPSDFYGGAFWPRYYKEGAGCSTFGFALLDVAGIIPEEAREWKVDIKIPMHIVGGQFNKGKKIKNSTIKRTKNWFIGQGKRNVDYVEYFVWDPAIMFDWVTTRHAENDAGSYQLVVLNEVPGLYKDVRKIQVDPNDSIFIQRPDSNLFIKHYYDRLNHHKK
jgi:hypothetical protein